MITESKTMEALRSKIKTYLNSGHTWRQSNSDHHI